jgi:hypothetical protein
VKRAAPTEKRTQAYCDAKPLSPDTSRYSETSAERKKARPQIPVMYWLIRTKRGELQKFRCDLLASILDGEGRDVHQERHVGCKDHPLEAENADQNEKEERGGRRVEDFQRSASNLSNGRDRGCGELWCGSTPST